MLSLYSSSDSIDSSFLSSHGLLATLSKKAVVTLYYFQKINYSSSSSSSSISTSSPSISSQSSSICKKIQTIYLPYDSRSQFKRVWLLCLNKPCLLLLSQDSRLLFINLYLQKVQNEAAKQEEEEENENLNENEDDFVYKDYYIDQLNELIIGEIKLTIKSSTTTYYITNSISSTSSSTFDIFFQTELLEDHNNPITSSSSSPSSSSLSSSLNGILHIYTIFSNNFPILRKLKIKNNQLELLLPLTLTPSSLLLSSLSSFSFSFLSYLYTLLIKKDNMINESNKKLKNKIDNKKVLNKKKKKNIEENVSDNDKDEDEHEDEDEMENNHKLYKYISLFFDDFLHLFREDNDEMKDGDINTDDKEKEAKVASLLANLSSTVTLFPSEQFLLDYCYGEKN